MRKTAVIGIGNMASAIIGGILSSGLGNASELTLYDKLPDKLDTFRSMGATIAESIPDAVSSAECVLLAVKPQNVVEVLSELSDVNLDGKLFISILAGISTEKIENILGRAAAVVRVMPNTPLQIGYGVSALARNSHVSDEDFDFACSIFEASGMILRLPEDKMNAVISVNGSSPAYFFYIIDAMVNSALSQGLDSENLLEAVCRSMIGSAELMLRSGKTPAELIRAVTSPNGTTERAMDVLRSADLSSTIDTAMRACTARAEELGR